MDFAGKTVIVTGAASGIGAATAELLESKGAEVVGIDRDPLPATIQAVEADLSDADQIDELVDRIPAGAHGLCNIAGVAPNLSGETVLRVNTMALIRLTERIAPTLADGASIVNLASMAGNGWRQNLGQVGELLATGWNELADFVARHQLGEGPRSYFLSKEAVIVWTMHQRWRWRSRGIRMNCVSPGPVETPILPDFIGMLGDRAQESIRNMDRHGHPGDVAPVVAFLLSDEAAWFRGANLTPDGGMGSHLALKHFGLDEIGVAASDH